MFNVSRTFLCGGGLAEYLLVWKSWLLISIINASHCPACESISRIVLAAVCITTLERGNERKHGYLVEIYFRDTQLLMSMKMVEDFEPFAVYGVEKMLIVYVNFMDKWNLVAFGNFW